jgi:hypothetical protein
MIKDHHMRHLDLQSAVPVLLRTIIGQTVVKYFNLLVFVF